MTAVPFTSAARAVLPALAEASQRTGVAFDTLFHTARLESGFNPDAKAPTSSATGLFQFIDSTWLQTLAKHGARHGLSPASREEALALRRDPRAASLMAAAHMADNADRLQDRLGRPAGTVDLYLAHFLGAGGAMQFLDRLASAPGSPAAALLPEAAKANRSIFFADGAPRSLQQVHDLFARRLGANGPMADPPASSRAALTMVRGMSRPLASTSGPVPTVEQGPAALQHLEAPRPATAPQAAQAARLAYLLLAEMGA
jgi:hypothetical protein